ncbi:helix-hairpin-helix domain-containing protein [Streptomyces sp. NPDC003487]
MARAPDGRRGEAGDGGAHGPHVDVESKAVEDSPAEDSAVEDDVVERAGARRRWWVGPAVRERMPVWLQARCGVERRGVLALTVLLVVAAALAVQHFWTGRTETVSAPEVVRAAAPRVEEAPTPDSRDASGVPGPATTAAAGIVVDVSGKVREPGIHRLPAGSRVADALRAAGGVRPGTDLHGLNRARFLVDGEQVVVGEPAPVAGVGAGGTGLGGPVGGAPGAPGAAPVAPVSLNTATVDQLDALPGVGPVLARHIVDYRTQHGGFRSVDELREVNGIGDRRFADLRELVRP